MSRSLRAVLISCCLVLAACGFEPLYGERGDVVPTEDLLSRVAVTPIADRVGQLVRIELTNRMTPTRPAPSPLYVLNVRLNTSTASLAVRKDATTTRANLTINAEFELLQEQGGERLTAGSVRSVNSYDILDSEFSTLAAEQDARRRGATDIANGIVDRLAVFLSRTQGQPRGASR